MKKLVLFTLALFLGVSFQALGKKPEILWRNLLKENANCVTWVSVTVKLEISAGGRSLPPQEQKLEALGTIIAEDGLTVLSLNKVDPTANILSRLRIPGCIRECKLHRSDAVNAGRDRGTRQASIQRCRPRPRLCPSD